MIERFIYRVNLVSFILGQLFVVHCAFSFGEKNGELYQLAVFSRKLRLLSESANFKGQVTPAQRRSLSPGGSPFPGSG